MKKVISNLDLLFNFKGVLLYFPRFNISIPLIYKCASTFLGNVGGYSPAPTQEGFPIRHSVKQDYADSFKWLEPCIRIDTDDIFKGDLKNMNKVSEIILSVRNPYERICSGFSSAPPYQRYLNELKLKVNGDKFDCQEFEQNCKALGDKYLDIFNKRLDMMLELGDNYPFTEALKIECEDTHSILDEHIKPYFTYFEDIDEVFKMDNFNFVDIKNLQSGIQNINKDFGIYMKFHTWNGAGAGTKTEYKVLDVNYLKNNHSDIIEKINKIYYKDFELFGYEMIKV